MVKKFAATTPNAAASAIVAVALVALVVGCGGGSKKGTTAPTTTASGQQAGLCAQAGLGYAGPLSGAASFLGDDQSNWEKLFIKSWNAGQPIPGVPSSLQRVKLTLALAGDSKLQANAAATVAQHMVSTKNILGMVGFAGSNENLGGGPVLDKAKLPYVSGSATLDTLASGAKGQKPLTYFYRVVPPNAIQAKTVPFVVSLLKIAKGDKVMVVDDGEAYGIGLADDAQAIFKADGFSVTRASVKETDNNPGGATGFANDIAPVAQQAAALKPKLVYAPTQDASDSQTFTQDLKNDGYTGAFMATDGSVSPSFTTAGAFLSFFGPAITSINKTYLTAFKKAYGAKSAGDPFGAPSFVAAEMLGVAISDACAANNGQMVTRAEVADQLKKVQLSSTILGFPVSFNNPKDAFRGPASGATLFEIQKDGSYKEIYAVK
jgi:ABC-type branched-subunit amino acid transport system substrate-binding protein